MARCVDGGPVKALVLMSGGLDSRLAVCVLKAQGIEVTGISFVSPFFDATKALQAGVALGVPVQVEEFTDTIVALVEHPKHGFGGNMNPCIDCHAAMLRRAGQIMDGEGYRFIATGEVLNQRPMSQTRRSLAIVATESGHADRILRPLSAKLLPETEAERRGWVDRDRLLDIEGRSRKRQLALAVEYGLKDWPPAAGGCKLTEPHFSARLRELKTHEGLREVETIRLLRYGRHFRLSAGVRLIVGRDAHDNEALDQVALAGRHTVLRIVDIPGPTALLTPSATDAEVVCAAGICARYSDAGDRPVDIEITTGAGVSRMTARATALDVIERLRIG
jgi:tRNA U34 2-thiouridine synthase MnmA/TrmU